MEAHSRRMYDVICGMWIWRRLILERRMLKNGEVEALNGISRGKGEAEAGDVILMLSRYLRQVLNHSGETSRLFSGKWLYRVLNQYRHAHLEDN